MTPARHQPWLASYQPGVPAQIDLSSFAAMDELLQTALEGSVAISIEGNLSHA